MISPRRLLLLAASSAAILAGATLPAIAQTAPAATSASSSVAATPSDPWAQAISDIPADPAVRFGVLPNGMRYAIRHNATPPHQAALRLRIDAGSLSERDDQQGLAHFLEHMAFNGSTHIAEGDMTKNLERLGMSFGGDTNAETSFDQTTYKLNLPNTSDEVVDASLFSLREVSSELLFAAEAVERERGVIVGEERTRDDPGYRSLKALFPFIAPGQRLGDRLPIGDLDIIRTAPRDRFVDFYRAYYRPERATLIAVGDFDVDAMEAKIKARFGDWTNPSANGPDPDLGQIKPRQPETLIHSEPGAQSSAQIFWTVPHDASPDTVAERRKSLVRSLGMSVLNRRFSNIARLPNPPFLGGGAGYQSLYNALDVGTLSVSFNPGGWKPAIETAEQEQRRLVQYGVGQSELDREITEYRTAIQAAAASAATRQTTGLAEGLAGAANDNEVFNTPADDLKQFNEAVASITVDEVNAATREAFSGNGPLVFITSPVAIEGGEAAVTAALEASRQTPVAAPVIVADTKWPYDSFGTPAQPSSQSEIADLGATLVTFPNGVRLTIKPTTFADKQILVSVRAGNGYLDLPTDRVTPVAWAAASELVEGGLGKLTAAQLEQVTAGNVVGASFGPDQNAFQYGGATRPEDLPLQMQLLAAYFTDPAWRPEPFARIQGALPQNLAQARAVPAGAFSLDATGLLYGGDPRFGVPTEPEVAAARLDDMKTLVTESVSRGPIEIIMVGDVTVADAIASVGATFGALPTRAAPVTPSSKALDVKFPAPTPRPLEFHHTGLPTQSLGYVAWPTIDSIGDRKPGRIVSLLSKVLQLRVTEELREKQGVAYSPGAGATSSIVFPGYGYVFTQIETPPEALPGFFESVDTIAAGLRDTPVTDDELGRARLSTIEGLRRSQANNGYWISALRGVQTDPAQLAAVRTAISDLEAVTPADLQKAAQTYLLPDRAWRAQVTAAAATAPAAETAPAPTPAQ
ncbi:MAG TPA: insulinase family protein [Brevundimonas sp.]